MNEFIYRKVPLPGSCKGFIKEDSNGDYNIYLNEDLSEEQLQRTIAHEEEHARRGDLQSDLAAQDLEKFLRKYI